MIKKLLFSLVFMATSVVMNAQDFALDTNDVDVSNGTIDYYVHGTDYTGKYTAALHLVLTNNASSTKKYILKRHNIEFESMTAHEICDNQMCRVANPFDGDHILYSPDGKDILAGDTAFFDIHVRFGTTEGGYSHEKYTFYEVGNESNKVELDVNYKFHSANVENTTAILVSKAFPNPANNSINFNYNLNTNGYITIHDVTGKQVANIELSKGIERATFNTSNINDGVYFYNVYINGVKTTTDKFIVRH